MWVFVIYLGCVFGAIAQSQQKVDSLISILETKTITQKEKARLLSKVAYNHPKPAKSLEYANASLEIALDLDDVELQAEAWEELSHVERLLGNNPKSFEATFKALRIYQKLNLKKRQAASYVQLGVNYVNDKDYASAIINLSKACDIYKANGNITNYAITLVNLGEAYRLSGALESATVSFNEVLNINSTLNNDMILAYALGNLGMVYATKGKTLEAKQRLKSAIEILMVLGDPYSLSIFLAEMGKIYKREGQLINAERNFIEALELAKSNGLKEQIKDISAILSTFYEDQENYKKALDYKNVYQKYQDSLINKANIQKIEQIKASYEIGLRETEIYKLNEISENRKTLTIGLVIGILLLGLFLNLLSRANKNLKEQKAIISLREKEKALLLSELNHRVKNNLQMMSSLLNLQSRELTGHPAQEALLTGKNRIEVLSLVHKKLYKEGAETKVFLRDYLEELVLGLFYGYDISFNPEINMDNTSISIDKAVPLALIINELVVNSLKHAYKDIKNPNLKIQIKEVNDKLEIDISDNGIGFTEKEGGKKNSFGIKLITSLVNQLDGSIIKLHSQSTHWKIIVKNA